jgi:hypothetical protein
LANAILANATLNKQQNGEQWHFNVILALANAALTITGSN